MERLRPRLVCAVWTRGVVVSGRGAEGAVLVVGAKGEVGEEEG